MKMSMTRHREYLGVHVIFVRVFFNLNATVTMATVTNISLYIDSTYTRPCAGYGLEALRCIYIIVAFTQSANRISTSIPNANTLFELRYQ